MAVGAVAGQPPADFGTKTMAAFRKPLSFAALIGRGEIEAVVHEVLPPDEAGPAHRKLEAGEVPGRIVLTP